MFCNSDNNNELVLNCKSNIALLYFNHFVATLIVVLSIYQTPFIYSLLAKRFSKLGNRFFPTRFRNTTQDADEQLLDSRFHAPVLRSTQRYRKTETIITARQFFAEMDTLKKTNGK